MLFAIAAKKKYRYPFKGLITTEDLFDLSTESLDYVYKQLNAQKKQLDDVGLIENQNAEAIANIHNKMQIVKDIYDEKMREAVEREKKLINYNKRQKILEAIAAKEDRDLTGKSKDELIEMLKELE